MVQPVVKSDMIVVEWLEIKEQLMMKLEKFSLFLSVPFDFLI